jgi:mutator protein MutT
MALLDGRAGLPDLCRRLLAGGRDVRAFEHAAAWIDVNDAGDLRRAEALVADNPDPLECWCPEPDLEVAGAVLCDGDRVLLDRRARGPARALWDTPGGKVEPGEAPAAALARELDEELGLRVVEPGAEVARFDALDPTGRVLRHHVFALSVKRGEPRAREGQPLEWFPRASLPDERSPVVARSLACLDRAGGEPRGAARAGW